MYIHIYWCLGYNRGGADTLFLSPYFRMTSGRAYGELGMNLGRPPGSWKLDDVSISSLS